MKTACKFTVVIGVNFERGEVNADGGGIADGRRTAHLQLADCRPDFALRFEMEIFGTAGELCLVDNDEGAFAVVEGDGFHIEDVGAHCMPPKLSDTSIGRVRPPGWSPARARGR